MFPRQFWICTVVACACSEHEPRFAMTNVGRAMAKTGIEPTCSNYYQLAMASRKLLIDAGEKLP